MNMLRRLRLSRVTVLVVVAAGVASWSVAGAGAHGAGCSVCGHNLIGNPGAEAGAGTNADTVVPVPDWKGTGGFTAALYSWSGGDVSSSTPGPAGEGKPGNLKYFYGGPNAAVSTGTQTVSLAGATGLTATLSGWLGGFDGQSDDTKVTASFVGASGQVLGSVGIGPVTEAERKGVSGMFSRTASATVPSGTVSATVVITMTRYAGSDNDGLADDLSLLIGQSTTGSGSTTTASTGTTTTSTSTTLPAPVSGVSADVRPVSGTVLVNGKPLVAGERIPIGATVDATNGRVALESVSPTGIVQSAQFYAGEFVLHQSKGGIMGLTLKGGSFGVCSRKGTRQLTAVPANKTVVRSLWGNGHGQFATKGRYAAATVRGTVWETIDRCDGTEIYVKQDSVSVLDLVTKKTVILRAGQSFLAKP
jgi:hypothetical protein